MLIAATGANTQVGLPALAGKANAMTAMGAMIFFWARLAYAVIYLIGMVMIARVLLQAM